MRLVERFPSWLVAALWALSFMLVIVGVVFSSMDRFDAGQWLFVGAACFFTVALMEQRLPSRR